MLVFEPEPVPRLPGPAVSPKGPKTPKPGAGFMILSSLRSPSCPAQPGMTADGDVRLAALGRQRGTGQAAGGSRAGHDPKRPSGRYTRDPGTLTRLKVLPRRGSWAPEGSLARFFGVRFWGLAGPGGPGRPLKMWGASRPTFWKAFPGPRGRPDLKNAPQKVRPDCRQVPRI